MPSFLPPRVSLRLVSASLLPALVFIGLLSGCGPQGRAGCGDGPPRHLQPGLTESDGQVYLSALDTETIYALWASDGVTRWHHTPTLSVLAVDAGVIYLQSGPYAVSALRANDGKTLWSKQSYDLFGSGFLTEAHQTLYTYQSSAGVLIALQGDTGVQRWKTRLPAPAAFQVSNGAVYVLSHQGQVLAVSEETGTVLWHVSLDTSSAPSTPALLVLPQGMLYAYTTQLTALQASTGHLLWQDAGQGWRPPLSVPDESAPVLQMQQGILYLRTLQEIDAVRASDGQLLWRHSAGIYTTAQLGDGFLYTVGSSDPRAGYRDVVEALRTSDGQLLWRYQATASSAQLSVTATAMSVYLLSVESTATLLAKQATDGTVMWESSVKAATMLFADESLYLGLAGNSNGACYAIADSQMEKLHPENGTPIWQIQLS